MIRCKRVYFDAQTGDGQRILVDRLWPRGLSRDALAFDEWLPEVAPSTELRKAFAHRVEAFDEFSAAYRRELAGHPEHWQPLLHWAASGTLTLLYAARDEEHNNARVLAEFLEGLPVHRTEPVGVAHKTPSQPHFDKGRPSISRKTSIILGFCFSITKSFSAQTVEITFPALLCANYKTIHDSKVKFFAAT